MTSATLSVNEFMNVFLQCGLCSTCGPHAGNLSPNIGRPLCEMARGAVTVLRDVERQSSAVTLNEVSAKRLRLRRWGRKLRRDTLVGPGGGPTI